ncbi:hypothetical protein GCM10027046_14430 [Uliginosibacterium flavum]
MWRALQTKRKHAGFTLLEVLVALSVFAIITLLAYRGLDSMATAKLRLDQEMHMWRELELVFERIGLDITQTAPRSWKDSTAGTEAPLRSAVQASTSESGTQCQLDVLRFGTSADHELVHVRYLLKEGQLTLEIIPENAQAAAVQINSGTQGQNLLLTNVERCELNFLDGSNKWLARWPASNLADPTRPRGMRLRLTLAGRGEFERLYYLP